MGGEHVQCVDVWVVCSYCDSRPLAIYDNEPGALAHSGRVTRDSWTAGPLGFANPSDGVTRGRAVKIDGRFCLLTPIDSLCG